MMRVITGVARGRRLETLPGDDVTRPTAESVNLELKRFQGVHAFVLL